MSELSRSIFHDRAMRCAKDATVASDEEVEKAIHAYLSARGLTVQNRPQTLTSGVPTGRVEQRLLSDWEPLSTNGSGAGETARSLDHDPTGGT